jgi:hypothetical protein
MSMLSSGQEMHTKVHRYFYLPEIHFVLPKSHDDVTKSHHQLSGQELINGNNQMLSEPLFFFWRIGTKFRSHPPEQEFLAPMHQTLLLNEV